MVTSLYIASAEPRAGKAAIALGVLDEFGRRLGRVAVFRPVVRSRDERDSVLELLLAHGGGQTTYEESAGVTYEDVHEDPEGALSRIVAQFHALAAGHDAVLVVGSDYTDVAQPTELALNARIAANIGAPVVLVVGAASRTPDQVADAVDIAAGEVEAGHARIMAIIANKADPRSLPDVVEEVRRHVERRYGGSERAGGPPSVSALPADPLLGAPTVRQLADAVGAEDIVGTPEQLAGESFGIVVAAMTLPRVLERLFEGATVVSPADRSDVILGVLGAHASQTFPSLSALVLNGDFGLEPPVATLIEGMGSTLPIFSSPYGTYETTHRLDDVRGRVTAGATRKIERALQLARAHLDCADLIDRLEAATPDVVTPMMFEHALMQRARAHRARIVLPEGTEPRILRAVEILVARDVVDLVLLGKPDEIAAAAGPLGVDLSGVTLIDPEDPELVEEFAAEYAQRRSHRGVTLDAARDRVVDVSYFGTMLVLTGRADGMVSGAVHTTAHTIRPAIELLRDPERVKTVSSAFFMCLPDRVLVFADCAIVPSPKAAELADIAVSSAQTATRFGIDPRVALLSYSTGSSGAGSDVEKVIEATALVRERDPEMLVEGPLQYDAAVDPGVAATKLPDSDVAGRATVLIFPDLNTGNNTYKAVQRSANAVAVGPVLQGLKAPVNDLSRGATVGDIVTTVVMTAVQSQPAGDAA
ncbi:phosphate acetyltransferase [Agilicoccus flavus]|uniref:phosphate acetyltransferase n=1 Tax=Agilicoccus flavus TaxID=2775968 RepID=UPI001CF6BB29|nr:phosphate acetyltransferase [Agilicoccus flavus]